MDCSAHCWGLMESVDLPGAGSGGGGVGLAAGEAPRPRRVLGQLLLAAGAMDEERLANALAEQRKSGERLGEILIAQGLDPEVVARSLAQQLGLAYAAPPLTPDPDAIGTVDRGLAMRYRVVPLELVGRGIRIAISDPLDLAVLDDLRFQTGRRVEAVVATRSAIDAALALAYGADIVSALVARLPGGAGAGMVGERVAGRVPAYGGETDTGREGGGDGETEETQALRRASEAPPVVALVDLILQRAAAVGASDIHVEPGEGRLRVRVRVDGVLREIMELPEETGAGIASRLKIMAGLDIAVKRRPQDGRSAVRIGGREMALRVSTLPSLDGEKVVLRILATENAGRELEELGFEPSTLRRFRALLGRGHGVILVTGPTGSGKTTTLYGALAGLDRERRNVLTLEDPVEYRLSGLTQVQVHRKAGLDFAAALRSVLRQDPDVIMVGELRDRETVETALAAALTGHLVLSTLHTNDAPSAVTRLSEMGAPHYLIASGLIGVLAQRLVRRVCEHCREERAPTPSELEGVPEALHPDSVFVARGCIRCEGTGYSGRIGVHELLVVNGTIRELIMRRAPTDEVRDAARAAGLRTLGQDAWDRVRAGVTTIEEVRPLVALLEDEAPLCGHCGAVLRDDFVACPGCGSVLIDRCGCGRVLEEGWRWCAGCGERLGDGK